MRFFRNCTLALFVLGAPPPAFAQTPGPSPQTFNVFLRGRQIGAEDVILKSTPEGWTIASTGRLGAPLNIVTRQFEMKYDAQWRPIELTIDAAINAEPTRIHTTFSGSAAASDVTQRGSTTSKSDTVAPDAIVLPNPFFGAFHALAARLSKLTPPADLKAYVVPQAQITLTVKGVAEERIQIGSQVLTARRFTVTFNNPTGAFDGDVTIDTAGNLLRVHIPLQTLEVVRQDIGSVAARIERVTRSNDEAASIPANGFSLAATISKPPSAPGRLPAVVLVPGSGPTDRDEVVAGIPIFALLANSLADAGFVVVRYDKRGAGQSGGRLEASTLADYAEDVRAAVKWLSNRKDVDSKRIAIVGHSEGGAVGLIAAAKEGKVSALVTVGTPATRGLELVLEQQQHALSQSKLTEAEKQTAVDFQRKVMQAAMTNEGWEGIPADVRRRVDTAWFRSFLVFEPATVMKDMKKPLLVVQGELDTQVPPHHGDDLMTAAKARKGNRPAELLKVPGVNHLMLPATTGEVAEYATLKDKPLSPQVVNGIVEWLQKTLPSSSS